MTTPTSTGTARLNLAALPHQLDYADHVEELTATLAQEAGERLPDYLARVDGTMAAHGMSRLQALGITIHTARIIGAIRRDAAQHLGIPADVAGCTHADMDCPAGECDDLYNREDMGR